MSLDNKAHRAFAEVNILGESLQVVSTSSTDYIKSVARYVNEKMYELSHNYPRMSRYKVMALGSMNLADELIKTKEEVELIKIEMEKILKEKEELELALARARKEGQHYQSEYEELVLLLEEVE